MPTRGPNVGSRFASKMYGGSSTTGSDRTPRSRASKGHVIGLTSLGTKSRPGQKKVRFETQLVGQATVLSLLAFRPTPIFQAVATADCGGDCLGNDTVSLIIAAPADLPTNRSRLSQRPGTFQDGQLTQDLDRLPLTPAEQACGLNLNSPERHIGVRTPFWRMFRLLAPHRLDASPQRTRCIGHRYCPASPLRVRYLESGHQ